MAATEFNVVEACEKFWQITDEEVRELKTYICNRLHYAYGETPITPADIRIRGPHLETCGDKEYFEMLLVKRNETRDPLFYVYIFKEDGSVKRNIEYYLCGPGKTIDSFREMNITVHGLELSLYEMLNEAIEDVGIDLTRLMFIEWPDLPEGLTPETLRKHHIEVQYYPYGDHAIDADILKLMPEEHRDKYFYPWDDDQYFSDFAIVSLMFEEDGYRGARDDQWDYYDHILCECDAYGVDMNHPFDPFHDPHRVILNQDMFDKVAQYCAMKFPAKESKEEKKEKEHQE